MTEPDRSSDPAVAATAKAVEQLGHMLEAICTAEQGQARDDARLAAAETILANEEPVVTLACVV